MPREAFYDEIEIEDFKFDPVANVYHYPCPCGDRFEITKSQLRDGDDVARCPSCSLIIRVIYEWDDFEDYDSADEADGEEVQVKQEVDGKVNGVAAVAEQLETSLNVSTTDGKREPEGDAKKTVLSFVFVTGNANKLKEVKAILAAGTSGIDVTNQGVDVPEVQGTTREVAIAKCKAAAKDLGTACVTEDTALCFEALNDLPGPYIKDFLAKLGHQGLNTLLDGFPTRRAYALCTFAYSPPPVDGEPQEPILFEGRTYGTIVPPRGPTHFGWDAVFQPEEGDGKTYAEMDGPAKNAISHRYRALQKLKEYLLSQ